MNEPEPPIRFRCKNCGQKIRIPKIHAGKKGKCPKCRNIVIVPQTGDTTPLASQTKPNGIEAGSKDDLLDPLLFDIPQKNRVVSQSVNQEKTPDETLEDLQKLEERMGIEKAEPEPVAERKLPWPIDIFLYPISIPGLINLAIITGAPLLVGIAAKLLGPFALALAIPGLIINIVIGLYMYWYFAECIRDSAMGGLRAPETLAASPDLGDLFSQTLNIVGCLILFLGPVMFYSFFTQKTDTIFWILLGYGIFFFPMGLLAVIMFDSGSAFSPVLLIGSISSVFFQYCGLVLLFCGVALIAKSVLDMQQSQILGAILHCVRIYLAMVAAHLLGRFYWKYQEKLNWEV